MTTDHHESDVASSLDAMFDVLSDRYRRRLLLEVYRRRRRSEGEAFGVDAFTARGELSEECRGRLRHVHLPKLAAAGFVAWDRERGTIGPGPHFREIEPAIRLLHDNRDELPDDWL
ncbi:DUF7344 domain-containing protein [Halomarina pelagica]|uniref:DUF7344 domain-containing protein n=1 Tax=Halomarina pelagica TaxID=2961599 RepID=UPI0020C479C8|nr:hypothetical protein [Halomarina sp. BND7]